MRRKWAELNERQWRRLVWSTVLQAVLFVGLGIELLVLGRVPILGIVLEAVAAFQLIYLVVAVRSRHGSRQRSCR